MTLARPSPRAALGAAGWSGTAHGFTATDTPLGALQSTSRLRERTWNCWATPLGRSDQRYVVALPTGTHVLGFDCIFTWYSITGSPLFTLGAQLRSRYRLPRCAFGVPGASGWRKGCSGSDQGDGSERPAALTATTRNW